MLLRGASPLFDVPRAIQGLPRDRFGLASVSFTPTAAGPSARGFRRSHGRISRLLGHGSTRIPWHRLDGWKDAHRHPDWNAGFGGVLFHHQLFRDRDCPFFDHRYLALNRRLSSLARSLFPDPASRSRLRGIRTRFPGFSRQSLSGLALGGQGREYRLAGMGLIRQDAYGAAMALLQTEDMGAQLIHQLVGHRKGSRYGHGAGAPARFAFLLEPAEHGKG